MYLAPLNYDRFFKKVFSDKEIARRFLEDFFDVEIESIELLKNKHALTDEAALVEFDFRCKIEGSYVIIDMQQWYKQDVSQRFYLYHALNTGLQLEDLPQKRVILDRQTKKLKNVKDYRALEPVLTFIWMVHDTLGFDKDYVSFAMSPEIAVEFIRNEKLWYQPEIVDLLKRRQQVLEVINNDSKDIDFIPRNRLLFAFQKNVVKNRESAKYRPWFEFAQLTQAQDNTPSDFEQFAQDEVFVEMMRRLAKDRLSQDEIVYIEDEREFWEEVERYDQSRLEEGYRDGVKRGLKDGRKLGLEEGRQLGRVEGIQQGIQEGIQQGIQEGIQQGIQQGRAEGVKEGQISTLRQLLSLKFGELPPNLMAELAQLNEIQLQQALTLVLTVDSIDAFRKSLNLS